MGHFKLIPLEHVDFTNHKYIFRRNLTKNGLKKSIENEGLLHPILFQKVNENKYIIVSGYRRALACQELRMDHVNGYIFDQDEFSEGNFLRIAIAENTKRKDLEPVEIAHALLRLQESLKLTTKQLAEQFGDVFGIGTSAKKIENYLKLNLLEDRLKDKINSGQIKADIAFKVAQIDDPSDREEMANLILENEGISRNHLQQIIENAKKLKVDNEMDSFREVFQTKGLTQAIQNKELPNRIQSFVRQLNREANPEKSRLADAIEKKIEAIYKLTQTEPTEFKGKLLIKKKKVDRSGVDISLTIDSSEELMAIIRLFQGTGGELLKEIIEPNLQRITEEESLFTA